MLVEPGSRFRQRDLFAGYRSRVRATACEDLRYACVHVVRRVAAAHRHDPDRANDSQYSKRCDHVYRGHQNGVSIAEPRQAEQGPEAGHTAHDPGAHGSLGQGLEAFDQGVAALDVHAGILRAVWRPAHAVMVTMPGNPGKP